MSLAVQERVLRERGNPARAVGALMLAGAGLVALSLSLPHPSDVDDSQLIVTAAAMVALGLSCLALAARIPTAFVHLELGLAPVAAGLLTYESGIAAGQYGAILVWTMLVAAYFFPRMVALGHLLWLLLVNAITLTAVPSTAGYSSLTRWTFTAVSLTVVAGLTSELVARRERADEKARRFFDLSRDMLCTANMAGYFVELNTAWTDCLGYSHEELRAKPFADFVHPDDREHTEAEAAGLFEGSETVGFENRYLAKDGFWHWLRWSSALSPDEKLIYARATDVTKLKKIEVEREDLLAEVEALAHSDSLTGLPNRRALEQQLPREMARARRNRFPLCLAILDLDHFKSYNDTHGHLAGDVALRDCAVAWDSELRGEDAIARFGGEEFVVVLPDCKLELGAEILERLRAVTPDGQTFSAGLACWDFAESANDLLDRADIAVYEAKRAGRDRVVY